MSQWQISFGGQLVKIGNDAPEFRNILGWFNTDGGKLSDFLGNVIFIEFWDHTNLSSLRGMEFTKRLWESYRDNGLVVIGVHFPEYEFERYLPNLQEAISKYGIEYPVAQDNNGSTWTIYGNRYIPKRFVISSDGKVLFEQIGLGNEYALEKVVRQELGEESLLVAPLWSHGGKLPIQTDISPDTYLGSREILSVKKMSGYHLAHDIAYNDPGDHEVNKVYLEGRWKRFEECLENEESTTEYLLYRYFSRGVYAVMSTIGGALEVEVQLDGRPVDKLEAGEDILWRSDGSSYVKVRFSGLYGLIGERTAKTRELKLIPKEKGVQIYVLSFE